MNRILEKLTLSLNINDIISADFKQFFHRFFFYVCHSISRGNMFLKSYVAVATICLPSCNISLECIELQHLRMCLAIVRHALEF